MADYRERIGKNTSDRETGFNIGPIFGDPGSGGNDGGSDDSKAEAGQVQLISNNIQNTVPPNTNIQQVVEVRNDNFYVGPTDPNRCEPGIWSSLSGGLDINVIATVNGAQVATENTCVGAAQAGIGARRKRVILEMTTPQNVGDYTLEIQGYFAGTGKHLGTITENMTVKKGVKPENPNSGSMGLDDPLVLLGLGFGGAATLSLVTG